MTRSLISAVCFLTLAACGVEKPASPETASAPEVAAPEESASLATQALTTTPSDLGIKYLGRYTFRSAVGDLCMYKDGDGVKTRTCSSATAFAAYEAIPGTYHMCLAESLDSFHEGDGTSCNSDKVVYTGRCIIRDPFDNDKTQIATIRLGQKYEDDSVRIWPGNIVARGADYGFVLGWRGSSRALTRKDSSGGVGLYADTAAINQQWILTYMGN